MKMKQISDSTIKITIRLEDLEERGMEIADFLVPQEKTEEFFYAILDELEMPDSFMDSGMLSFRVTPKADRLDIFVTKSKIDKHLDFENMADLPDFEDLARMSPDEFIKTLEKTIGERTQEDKEAIEALAKVEAEEEAREVAEEEQVEPDRYIYYILEFADLTEVLAYTAMIDYEVDTSELYKMEDRYYLTILVDVENQPASYPGWLLARMREYADDTDMTRSLLQEHGHLLLVGDAVESLQRVKIL